MLSKADAKSKASLCHIGVPQGSVIGPLSYILYILGKNDLADIVSNAEIVMHTNNTKLFLPVTTIVEQDLLQYDLHKVAAWFSLWHLKLNSSKYIVLRLKNSNTSLPYIVNSIK